jgi:hypothetical protein
VSDYHTTVSHCAIQHDVVVGARQADLLNRHNVEIGSRAPKCAQNVMAGVFVPEEPDHR